MLEGWVADDGPGVSPVDQARIFERFYKADRTRTSGGGTGLGLAIARHIVEGHGGAIRVDPTRAGERPSRSRSPSRTPPTQRSPGRRRGGLPVPEPGAGDGADRILVATLNLRNIADRWGERIPLLADMAALQPDLLGLQEVFAVQQDRILGAAGVGHYVSRRGWAGRPEYGNAVLGRSRCGSARASASSSATIARRFGSRSRSGGTRFDFVVTHLHHEVDDEAVRADQSAKLIAWPSDITWPLVVVGDFNAEPVEPTYRQMIDAGFRSAFAEANGAEPAVTWPSGIKAPRAGPRWRPGLPRLHLAARGGHGRGLPPRVRPARGWRPDALPVGPPRARGARPVRWLSSGADVRAAAEPAGSPGERPRTLRLAHRGDWRAAPRELPRGDGSRAPRPRVPRPRVRCSGLQRRCPDSAPRPDLRRVQGLDVSPSSPDRRRVRGARDLQPRRGAQACGLRSLPRRRAQGEGPGGDRPPRAGAGRVDDDDRPALRDAVVSSFDIEILRWLADERPTWPRWLNAIDLFPADDRAGARPRVRGSLLRLAPDEPAVARATDAGLKVAAWTVRSNADYERLAGLGVVAICAEAEALDG